MRGELSVIALSPRQVTLPDTGQGEVVVNERNRTAAEQLRRQNKRLKKQNCRQQKRIEELEESNKRLRLELLEYRQHRYKSKPAVENPTVQRVAKKRGAPKGHPGWSRTVPKRADDHIEVTLQQCPECGGRHLRSCKRYEDHYQEDIVLPQVKVTRFRKHFYYCRDCGEVVHGVGEGELPGSYIGPVAKSVASFMHFQMKVPYRKLQLLFRELFNLNFTPSAAPGFDSQIRCRGATLYEQMRQRLPAQSFAHVDETGWKKDGVNYWLWCVAVAGMVFYHIDRHRGGKVVMELLGKRFAGVLISDFLAAYNRIRARKQRCLVHLLRLLKKWQVYFADDCKRRRHFTQLKALIKSVISLSAQLAARRPRDFIDRRADLIAKLRRMLKVSLAHPRADKFLAKLSAMWRELVTCLEIPGICAHNNLAERLLRDNVIMRKITFGNRSTKGMLNHQVLMSLIQTARIQNRNPLTFLHLLLTKPAAAAATLLPPLSPSGS
jgi:transposase